MLPRRDATGPTGSRNKVVGSWAPPRVLLRRCTQLTHLRFSSANGLSSTGWESLGAAISKLAPEAPSLVVQCYDDSQATATAMSYEQGSLHLDGEAGEATAFLLGVLPALKSLSVACKDSDAQQLDECLRRLQPSKNPIECSIKGADLPASTLLGLARLWPVKLQLQAAIALKVKAEDLDHVEAALRPRVVRRAWEALQQAKADGQEVQVTYDMKGQRVNLMKEPHAETIVKAATAADLPWLLRAPASRLVLRNPKLTAQEADNARRTAQARAEQGQHPFQLRFSSDLEVDTAETAVAAIAARPYLDKLDLGILSSRSGWGPSLRGSEAVPQLSGRLGVNLPMRGSVSVD